MLALLILAGCGGSGQSKVHEWQAVTTPSFHFRAPKSSGVYRLYVFAAGHAARVTVVVA